MSWGGRGGAPAPWTTSQTAKPKIIHGDVHGEDHTQKQRATHAVHGEVHGEKEVIQEVLFFIKPTVIRGQVDLPKPLIDPDK